MAEYPAAASGSPATYFRRSLAQKAWNLAGIPVVLSSLMPF